MKRRNRKRPVKKVLLAAAATISAAGAAVGVKRLKGDREEDE